MTAALAPGGAGRLAAFRQVVVLAAPTMGMYLLFMSKETISLLFLSRVSGSSAHEVAGLGLGNLVFNCAALSVGFGFTGSQDTLVTQAYGRGRHDLCALYLHRCQLWMCVVFVVSGAVIAFTEPLLLLLGACDGETASHAGTYTRLQVLGLFAVFQYSALRKFLMAQKLPRPGLWVQCVSVPLHATWCALLVPRLRIQGVGIALAIQSWIDFALIAAYTSFIAPRPSCRDWFRFWRALKDPRRSAGMLEYLRLTIPVVTMMCAEWWAFELLGLAAGYFHSAEKLAAHVTATNVSSILYLAGTGAQKATSTLVGNATGRGAEGEARSFFRASWEFNLVVGTLMGLMVAVARHQVAAVFVPNSAVVQSTLAVLLPMLAIQGLIDGMNQVLQGVLQGFGLQAKASRVSLFTYWLVMLPLAVTLGFPLGLGVPGLWLGCILSSAGAVLLNVLLYRRTNFAEVFAASRARMEADTLPAAVGEQQGPDGRGLVGGGSAGASAAEAPEAC